MSRLATTTRGLVTFTMACDPDYDASLATLQALAASGVAVLEIGMPFSDPMADGPVIQAAGLRALASGCTLARVLELVADFRRTNDHTPIVLMGYYNPIYRYGVELFCADALRAGVDGLIIVDLPPEEAHEITPYLGGLDFIRLIAPTSLATRLPMICAQASGFVYYVSVAGVTGAKSASATDLATATQKIRAQTKLPIAIGFGISTPEQVKAAAQMGDLVVVGSALIAALHGAEDPALAARAFVTPLVECFVRHA
jgi:tryptophan synthase alpha chain